MKFYTDKDSVMKTNNKVRELTFIEMAKEEGIYRCLQFPNGDCFFVVLGNKNDDTTVLYIDKEFGRIETADHGWENHTFMKDENATLVMDII